MDVLVDCVCVIPHFFVAISAIQQVAEDALGTVFFLWRTVFCVGQHFLDFVVGVPVDDRIMNILKDQPIFLRIIETGVCPKYAGCVNGVQWFKDHDQWADNSIEPSPGMIIFFDWDSPEGSSGPQDGESDHTGIVEKVENGIVYTVEGNSGDACRQRQYAIGHYEILGYGVLIP